MFKSQLIKSSQRVLGEHTYGATLFAPDYSATVLVAKMYTCHHERSI
jgi:hypothetical protein